MTNTKEVPFGKKIPGKLLIFPCTRLGIGGVKKLLRQTPELPCFLPNDTSLKKLK
jgi:hypothetical protein